MLSVMHVPAHSLISMSLLVEEDSSFMNHGGLLKVQHVFSQPHPCLSQRGIIGVIYVPVLMGMVTGLCRDRDH